MQRIQIGALYMFSYITQDVLDLLERYQDLISDEELLEEDELTYFTFLFCDYDVEQ